MNTAVSDANLNLQSSDRAIALDLNTAQVEFEAILKKTSKRKRELHIPIPLYGALNLAVLKQNNYNKIKALLFSKGSLTTLLNVPEGIEVLYCNDNLLKELKDLPESLIELEAGMNMLEKIDIAKCKSLAKLQVSFNELAELEHLPESLKTLHCNHNRLKKLDLRQTVSLTTLHCHENPSLQLESIPSSVIDGKYPEKFSQLKNKSIEVTSQEYKRELADYFKLKSMYQNGEQRVTKEHGEKLCPGCKKKVGVVFSNKNRKYQARCGGNPPCTWNIVIHRGQYESRETIMQTYTQYVEELKEKIIQQKMSTLFRHMGEQKAAKMFEEEMTAYKKANAYLEELKKEYNELFANETAREQMEQKQKHFNELKEQVNVLLKEDKVREAVEIQYREMMPLAKDIQRMEYDTMRVYLEEDTNHDVKQILLQEEVAPEKMEINLAGPEGKSE